jgi:hypothetical protein
MDKALRGQIIKDVTAQLAALGIDVYLILTSEGSDPVTSFIPGVGTVGAGAFAFTREGKRYALSTKIDAQDIQESGLFDQVIRYDAFEQSLAELMHTLCPRVIALNQSMHDPRCDGLTVGRRRWLDTAMPEGAPYAVVSSDQFLPELFKRYGE